MNTNSRMMRPSCCERLSINGTCRSHFSVLASRFVFKFGSGFVVQGSWFGFDSFETSRTTRNLNPRHGALRTETAN